MSSTSANQLTVPVSESDHIQGSPYARATLVEYGDYQCSYCGAAYSVVKELQKRLGGDLRFVFRDFPLTQIHDRAQAAAEAAAAAGDQNAFWDYHDLLYEHQDALSRSDFDRYAADLDLDPARFDSELDNHAHLDRIRRDFMGGVESGVNGTPTFFINGQRYDGPADVESLSSAIQQAGS